jgi:hypothetical protein
MENVKVNKPTLLTDVVSLGAGHWNPIFKPEVKAESLPKGIVKIVKE